MGLTKELDVFQAYCEEEVKVNEMGVGKCNKVKKAVGTIKSALSNLKY